ncbi:Rrf2 family transcriptional regulator [Biostraticola tofi]|uniref:DNA-binding IscR family transcriptional regulator n=1 Tax=Biostraticola tofi TaxID=466109 RepID=A0A4R3YUM3_9GAMM|nr:Rrf2 family transcriptional regulator [Biostraticola tofi]TCV96785.1 DNA-binding IscR family transcriptional regulator [Biostraticola tofi]
MKRDSKLSGILHVLLHMAEYHAPVTSEKLSEVMATHPVVIRRLMAGLRERGFVSSEKGHGGGWRLTCNFAELTLLDIWRAVGETSLISLSNRTDAPACLVEQAVNRAINKASQEAEALLIARLGDVTLAQLSIDFHQHFSTHHPHHAHGAHEFHDFHELYDSHDSHDVDDPADKAAKRERH